MMNRSPIEWCEFTWNPITGCYHNCPYCYAAKMARRFAGDVRLNLASGAATKYADTPCGPIWTLKEPFGGTKGNIKFPAGFAPTLHEYRLSQPAEKKKPANIFVCSMSDLFGEWVPDEWIRRVFDACDAAPWHNYLFLTKNPQRLCDFANDRRLPARDNWWWGSSVTKRGDRFFGGRIRDKIFLSIEPLHGSLDAGVGSFGGAKWIIIGAETGNRRGKIVPHKEWIRNIITAASITHARVLMKDSPEMRAAWGDDLIKEYPPEIMRIRKEYRHG